MLLIKHLFNKNITVLSLLYNFYTLKNLLYQLKLIITIFIINLINIFSKFILKKFSTVYYFF